MLFIQSNSLPLSLSDGERLRLLKALAARGLNPLIRSARYRFFQLLAGRGGDAATAAGAADELDDECAAGHESQRGGPYTPGELFCTSDCVLYLVFGGGAEASLSAGVVYSIETAEPLAKLERFCRDVREALGGVGAGAVAAAPEGRSTELAGWRPRAGSLPQGLARFMELQPADFVRAAAAFRGGRELARA